MSLTRLLDDRHGPVREFFENRLPHLKGFQRRWRDCGPAQLVAPPGAGPPGTVGTAFDYRLRYLFVVTPPERLLAARGAVALAARREPEDAAEAMGPLSEGSELFAALATALNDLTGRLRPVGRRLAPDEEAELCRYCYLLALYDECFRMGAKWRSPLQQLRPDASLDDGLALVPDAAVEDLAGLVGGLHRSDLPSFSDPVIANPTFAGSTLVGGADADLIIGDCLIDVKATVQGLQRDWSYQLIGYALLDFEDALGIRRLGFYHARVATVLVWDLQEMLDEAANASVDIDDLRDAFRRAVPGRRARQGRPGHP